MLSTKRQNLKARNYEIFKAFQTGTKVPALMKEHNLSQRAIYKILNQRNDENIEWFANLPIKTTQAMHEVLAREAWVQIEDLKTQKQAALKQGELALAAGITDKLIGHITKYDTLLVNGITLSRIKRVTQEVKRVIAGHRLKQT